MKKLEGKKNGNEMKCLVCMKHRVKWLVKQDGNDNETLILNKMVTNHKNWHKTTLNKNCKVSQNWHQNSN